MSGREPGWYVDVGDVRAHFARHRFPSGVQRVVLSLLDELAQLPELASRLRLFEVGGRGLRSVPAAALPRPSSEAQAPSPVPTGEPLASRIARRLPEGLRGPLRRTYHTTRHGGMRLASTLLGPHDEVEAQAGDWLVVAGAGWSQPVHAHHVVRLTRARSLRLALLVHDLIPSVRPQWHGVGARRFERWLASLLAHAERVATVSQHTRADLLAFAEHKRLSLRPEQVQVLRLGEELLPLEPHPVAGLERPFALCVGTVEARKNQRLLVEMWRHLQAELGREALPTLVLAGRHGVGSKEVRRRLEQLNWLDGRVVWRVALTDAELAWAYRHAEFTLVPSRYEGWGLPVAESLAHGTPCIAAAATSLTEAGAGYAEFVPLDDWQAWLTTVSRYIVEEEVRRQARERLRERPVRRWVEVARDVVAWLR